MYVKSKKGNKIVNLKTIKYMFLDNNDIVFKFVDDSDTIFRCSSKEEAKDTFDNYWRILVTL